MPEWARAKGVYGGENEAAKPCLAWLRWALVAALLLQGAMYALSSATTSCTEGRVRVQLWIWLAALPALAFRSYVEWKAVTHMAPAVCGVFFV